MNNDMTTSVANGRHCAGKLFGLMVALQCLAAATAFGKTFTLDLRAPSFGTGVRAFPALKNETAATASEDIAPYLEGKTVRKVIVVKNIVNIVVS